MKFQISIFIAIAAIFITFRSNAIDSRSPKTGNFDMEKDLLLVQFDCKTDVDDLQAAAAAIALASRSATRRAAAVRSALPSGFGSACREECRSIAISPCSRARRSSACCAASRRASACSGWPATAGGGGDAIHSAGGRRMPRKDFVSAASAAVEGWAAQLRPVAEQGLGDGNGRHR